MMKNMPKQNISEKTGVLQFSPVSGLNENSWVLLSASVFYLC